MTDTRVCETKLRDGGNCSGEGRLLVHWPGRSLVMCKACALRAARVAEHMGFALTIAPAPVSEATL